MLGRLVVLLLLANLGWWAWSQGWMQPLGLGPVSQAEPERLQRQLRPEALQLQPPSALPPAASVEVPAEAQPAPPDAPTEPVGAASELAEPAAGGVEAPPGPAPQPAVTEPDAPAVTGPPDTPVAEAPAAPESLAPPEPPAAPEPPEAPAAPAPAAVTETRCLQAGPFDAVQIEVVRGAVAVLPPGSWGIEELPRGGRWMVYLGPLAAPAAVTERRAELRARGIDTDRPGAALEPGLSLGRYSTEAAAERALADLARQGVSDARVVVERRDAPTYRLRLPQADAELDRQARALSGVLAGREWRECEPGR